MEHLDASNGSLRVIRLACERDRPTHQPAASCFREGRMGRKPFGKRHSMAPPPFGESRSRPPILRPFVRLHADPLWESEWAGKLGHERCVFAPRSPPVTSISHLLSRFSVPGDWRSEGTAGAYSAARQLAELLQVARACEELRCVCAELK